MWSLTMRWLIVLVVLAAGLPARPWPEPRTPQDWRAELAAWLGECEWAVLGTVVRPDGPTALDGRVISVERVFKGPREADRIIVDAIGPFGEERAVRFLRRDAATGGLVVAHAWSADAWETVDDVLARLDRRTRIAGMPAHGGEKGAAIAVTIGADDGRGHARSSIALASLADLRLLIQIENRAEVRELVMPPLDGSEAGMRYPHYAVELTTPEGKAVELGPLARCGVVNPFTEWDFVELAPGEVLRTSLRMGHPAPAPGAYRLRLTYEARRDARTRGMEQQDPELQVVKLIGSVWEGEAVSNWIDVQIRTPVNQ
jgi:hypothetical protein